MKTDDSAAIFARISKALARIDNATSQADPANSSDAMASLQARNAALQAAAKDTVQEIDKLIASLEKVSI